MEKQFGAYALLKGQGYKSDKQSSLGRAVRHKYADRADDEKEYEIQQRILC